MALILAGTLTFSASKVICTDTTGAYNVATNPTGYGAPNPLFTDFAHYTIIRKKNVNSIADAVLVLDAYNPITDTVFQTNRATDGWYEANMLKITKWTAGTYPATTVRYYNGVVYKAASSTSSTPGTDGTWASVGDLTTIEDNASISSLQIGRVTAYDADVYWSKQKALSSQRGKCGECDDDKLKKRLDDIYRTIQCVLVADQFGNNTDGEFNVLRLIAMGAKR